MAHRITRHEVYAIYEALADFHDDHNRRPTKSDLRSRYGFTRTQLRAAERKGYIESRYRETERGRVTEWYVPAFRPVARFWWWVVRVRRWFRRVLRKDTFYGVKKRDS